jgi:DNA-binding NarL/FixJ family response regulator
MRILIADDHPLYREAIRGRLERLFPDSDIVEAASLDEAIASAHQANGMFDLFLVDFHMPGMSLQTLPMLLEAFPGVPVAVVSGTANASDVRATIQAGARGFLPKTATGQYMASAIELLLAGGTSVPADLLLDWVSLGAVAPTKPAPGSSQAPRSVLSDQGGADRLGQLTVREMEVLKAVSRGLSNKEIGRELDLAEVTIKLHLRGVFRKIGARTRSEAAVIATKAGIG